MRILLFLATNLAVIVLASITFRLLGFESILQNNGVDLDLTAKPGNDAERWLLGTVERLADKAGISMPEVAIFPSPEPNAFATHPPLDDRIAALQAMR